MSCINSKRQPNELLSNSIWCVLLGTWTTSYHGIHFPESVWKWSICRYRCGWLFDGRSRLAAKQVYFDAMHTIDQYLSSISQHCVSSFRSNGMNADEIQYFGFPLYLMYTYNKQYMSVTVVPPSSHYFWYVLSRSKWTVVWWMDEWHVMSSAFVVCWTRRFLCWRCNPLGFRYSQRVPSTYWSRCRWCSGPRWIFWRWYSRPDGKSVLSKFYFQSILPPTPEQCRWTFTIFSGNRCHLSVG